MRIFEHKLAIAFLVLGVLAIGSVALFGPVIVLGYLGIPAFVTGAILLSRIGSHGSDGRLPAMFETILGIILGVLPLAFARLATSLPVDLPGFGESLHLARLN
jgi:uncharacterized membrane protein HdeD (DUF308 family)